MTEKSFDSIVRPPPQNDIIQWLRIQEKYGCHEAANAIEQLRKQVHDLETRLRENDHHKHPSALVHRAAFDQVVEERDHALDEVKRLNRKYNILNEGLDATEAVRVELCSFFGISSSNSWKDIVQIIKGNHTMFSDGKFTKGNPEQVDVYPSDTPAKGDIKFTHDAKPPRPVIYTTDEEINAFCASAVKPKE